MLEVCGKVSRAGVRAEGIDQQIVAVLFGYLPEQFAGIVEPGGNKGREKKAGDDIEHELARIAPEDPHFDGRYRRSRGKVNLCFVLGICEKALMGWGMQRHSWRENTEDGIRFFRASYHSSRWTLHSQLKGEEEWQPHEPIREEEWRKLRDVLWRKYQRRRCPWELIERIDRLLEAWEERDVELEGGNPSSGVLRGDKEDP